jgi:hypothetical protein
MLKGIGGMTNLLKQAQKVQAEMARLQEELKDRVVEGTSGGGMVTAMVNGQQEVVAIKIDPEVARGEEVEMLEDLVVAAVNQAMKKSRELLQEEMKKITGGLNIPGLFP